MRSKPVEYSAAPPLPEQKGGKPKISSPLRAVFGSGRGAYASRLAVGMLPSECFVT